MRYLARMILLLALPAKKLLYLRKALEKYLTNEKHPRNIYLHGYL